MRGISSPAPPCTQFHRHRPSSVALVTFLLSVLCPASAQALGQITGHQQGSGVSCVGRPNESIEYLAHTCLSFFKGGPGLDVGMVGREGCIPMWSPL